MDRAYDVVIVGGAIVGSSIAYHLAAEPDFAGSVLVVERDPTYLSCATARSWGGIRQQFTTPESIAMSRYGVEFYRAAGERLAVDGEGPDLGFVEAGYLLLSDEEHLDTATASYHLQRAHGAAVELHGRDELAERYPELGLDGIAAGTFGYHDEGWIDPVSLLTGFRRKARSLGVEYVAAEVVGLVREGDRIIGVCLSDGRQVGSGVVINAAGAHAAAVARLAGVELPIGPQKLVTFVFDCAREVAHAPLTADVSGLLFRREGGSYLAAIALGPDENPWTFDFDIDYDVFEKKVWPLLARRVKAFEAIKMRRAWSGHLDCNHLDHNAVLGPHPSLGGLLFANGFSGHGVMHSPATGRAISELIVHGKYRSLDLSRFGFQRILDNEPVEEAYVLGGTT